VQSSGTIFFNGLTVAFLEDLRKGLSMSQENRYVVIMAGGKGERFWPQSRLSRPKHLLPIVGDAPMLTQTIERLGNIVPMENILIVTNSEQRDAVLEICPMLAPGNVIAEPVGRDTAAAVGLSTILVASRDPQATFAMLPADHVIHDEKGFQSILNTAFSAAESEDALVTVGIKAEYPATGYGYIERGEVTNTIDGREVYKVEAFKEKPDAETAKSYVESGNYDWNAGMFFWQVPVISKEFETHTPGLWKALGEIHKGLKAGKDLNTLLAEHYPSLEKISVDYAIMEKAKTVRVVGSDFDWDDVGEWPAVERHYQKDASGNVTRGSVVTQDCSGNIVISDNSHTLALIGVDDLIVVHTGDATLVCPKSKAQEIKQLVKTLGADKQFQHLL
jgi:mannose-1-phosphate guanylyltransferase